MTILQCVEQIECPGTMRDQRDIFDAELLQKIWDQLYPNGNALSKRNIGRTPHAWSEEYIYKQISFRQRDLNNKAVQD